MVKYLILNGFFIAALSACTLGPEKRDDPTVLDLGAPRIAAATTPVINATLLIPLANAAAWLDNNRMQYRLAYQNAGRSEAYAQNRWVTTPAQMLTERLRARLAGASRGVLSVQDGAKADVALNLELEDFSQSFDTVQSSKVIVRARTSLIDANTRLLLAQRTFNTERPAAPNAPGAAQALAGASDALVEDVVTWATQQLKK